MRARDFLNRLEHQRITDAIAAAEQRSSGEIRVYIDRRNIDADPVKAASAEFLKLGMQKTAGRNAILIFIAPRSQKFAVIGDEAVHRLCGEEFWQDLVSAMRSHFKREEFTDAIVEAVETAGDLLARHFPRRPDDQNELPDAPVER